MNLPTNSCTGNYEQGRTCECEPNKKVWRDELDCGLTPRERMTRDFLDFCIGAAGFALLIWCIVHFADRVPG